MKINRVQIDGFGVWGGLAIGELDAGLNVFYGPNEAGKTTLLQFIRSMLYGFSPERQSYFPPLHGGRAGGVLELVSEAGRFEIGRWAEPGGDAAGAISILAADGTRQGEHLLAAMLSGVDEAIYNNVFAVGLHEVQELATLSDGEAADLLYNISSGVDRVCLVDVVRELETSRRRILGTSGDGGQLTELLGQRDKLQAGIDDLGKVTLRYGRLAGQQQALQQEIVRLEEECTQVKHEARTVDLALALRERWQQRAELDGQLAALGTPRPVPEAATARLGSLETAIARHRERLAVRKRREAELRSRWAELKVDEAVWRQAAPIEVLCQQQTWIAGLEETIAGGEKETAALQAEIDAQCRRAGLPEQAAGAVLPAISSRVAASLRPLGRAATEGRRRVAEAERESAAAWQSAETLSQEFDAAMSARGERDLAQALDRAGNELSQLRRRAQVDERLSQLTKHRAEVDRQSQRLMDRQLLPAWVLFGLGTLGMFGVILLILGFVLPTSVVGALGWVLAPLGLLGIIAAVLAKVVFERSNVQRLDACHKQTAMLDAQVKQATEEGDALDRQLARSGTPLAVRLEQVQQQLAALEQVVPLDSRRQAAMQDAEMADRRVSQGKTDLTAAVRRWRESLAAAGLPTTLSPGKLRRLLHGLDQIVQVRRRLEAGREELARRRSELQSFSDKIAQLASEAGLSTEGQRPLDRLQALSELLREQQGRVGRRRVVRRRWQLLHRKRLKLARLMRRLKSRRSELLRRAGVKNAQELRQRALEYARAELLRSQRDGLQREIAETIAGHCAEEVVGSTLQGDAGTRLDAAREQLAVRLQSLEKQLQERFEERGSLTQEQRSLVADRRLAESQLDLAVIQRRIAGVAHRWQVLAVTNRILDSIRTAYEQHRQPESLQEASGYLERLTQGRYGRVWTPLGEHVLRVDDREGNPHPVELLSRGTREQVFLALRLALAASYARRGAALPMVLDDVLVNFDAQRAKAAAGVLRDFAAAGHQVLAFTCHEHMLKLFRSLHVPGICLPDSAQADHPPITMSGPPKPKARRRAAGRDGAAEIAALPDGEDEETNSDGVEEYSWPAESGAA